MFAHFELPDEFYQNDSSIREIVRTLNLPAPTRSHELTPNKQTASGVFDPDMFCIVRDGIIKVYANSRLLYFLETGDVFFTTPIQNMRCVLFSEFASIIDVYDLDALLATADSAYCSQLVRIQQTILAQLHILLQSTTPPEIDLDPITKTYAPGDVIIIQETSPEEVFTLLSGHADVYMNDKKVGEVLVGEIFGAMAVTGNIPRSASVIAQSHCVALSLPKQNFLELARTHPDTLFKLIDTMSRIIIDLNQRLKEV